MPETILSIVNGGLGDQIVALPALRYLAEQRAGATLDVGLQASSRRGALYQSLLGSRARVLPSYDIEGPYDWVLCFDVRSCDELPRRLKVRHAPLLLAKHPPSPGPEPVPLWKVCLELSERFCAARGSQPSRLDGRPLRTPPPSCHGADNRLRVAAWLSRLPLCNRRVAISPGGYNPPEKRWPALRFGEFAARLLTEGAGVILLGAAEERALVGEVASVARAACPAGASRLLDLAGQTDLMDLPPLLDAMHLHVTNDNGLAHVAGALNRPQVILYLGPDTDHVTLGFRDIVLLSGTHGIEAIEIEVVMAAAQRVLRAPADIP